MNATAYTTCREYLKCKLKEDSSFLEDSSFGSNFRDPKAAVSWKLGYCSTCASLKIWIITHEH